MGPFLSPLRKGHAHLRPPRRPEALSAPRTLPCLLIHVRFPFPVLAPQGTGLDLACVVHSCIPSGCHTPSPQGTCGKVWGHFWLSQWEEGCYSAQNSPFKKERPASNARGAHYSASSRHVHGGRARVIVTGVRTCYHVASTIISYEWIQFIRVSEKGLPSGVHGQQVVLVTCDFLPLVCALPSAAPRTGCKLGHPASQAPQSLVFPPESMPVGPGGRTVTAHPHTGKLRATCPTGQGTRPWGVIRAPLPAPGTHRSE